jgi:alternate signal-mediated exported protein
MDNPLKGAVALCAAGLLLLGGAGTYALSSVSVERQRAVIRSDQLHFSDTLPGEWADTTSGTPVAIPDIDDFLVGPGDVLTYTLVSTVRARGDNLATTLKADPSSISDNPQLLNDVDVTTDVSVAGRRTSAINGTDDGRSVDVVVTLAFARGSSSSGELARLDLSKLRLTLQQDAR